MRDYAERVAMEINAQTELEAEVRTKELPDGTQLYGVGVREPGAPVAPVIYVDGMKERGFTIEQATMEVLKVYEANKEPGVDVEWFKDFENVKEKLFVRLLPATYKTEVYRSAKTYGFDDLILVPTVKVDMMGQSGQITIQKNHLENWGVTKREVIDTAIRNTKKEDVMVRSMASFMEQIAGYEEEIPESLYGPMIVSNRDGSNGASAILGRLKEFKKAYADGFFVLPSSIHEVLVIPKEDGMDKDYLDNMVREVNRSTVLPAEVLADHAYAF